MYTQRIGGGKQPVMRKLVCAAVAIAGMVNCGQLLAHSSEFPHAHLGATLAPEYNAFAGIWYQNIRYANAPGVEPNSQSLDVYTLDLPPANAPVMIYAHGGGGDRGDKAWSMDLNLKPAYFIAREGFVFVSINYRLGAEGAGGNVQQDFADAVAWVHNNIAKFGGDPNRIFLSGHSFAAGVVATVGTSETLLKKAGKDLNVLKGVIVIDGAGVDGKDFKSDRYLPSFLLLNTLWNAPGGTGAVKRNQSMLDALHATGHTGELVQLPGKDHYMASADIGVHDDPATLAIHNFLNTVLGRQETRAFPPCCTASPSLPRRR